MDVNINIYNYSKAEDIDCQAKACFESATKTLYIGMDDKARCHFHLCENHLKEFIDSLHKLAKHINKESKDAT